MKNVTKTLLVVLMLGAIALAGCSFDSSTSEATFETISPDDAAAVIAEDTDAVILDIRTPDEFNAGIIKDAINIDYYETSFSDDLDALDKDAHYVVYCNSGNRSGDAMSLFEDLGFTNITEIDGGIQAWYNSGLPVVFP
ncbi:MAG: rhodanese-like domain-containing protein [Actinomycetota bacterium]